MFFNRFGKLKVLVFFYIYKVCYVLLGKCSRRDTCPYIHDPGKIAVCTRCVCTVRMCVRVYVCACACVHICVCLCIVCDYVHMYVYVYRYIYMCRCYKWTYIDIRIILGTTDT